MAISKVPWCPSCIAKKGHIVKPGTAEQRKKEYRNNKCGCGKPNPGQTVSTPSLTRINQD